MKPPKVRCLFIAALTAVAIIVLSWSALAQTPTSQKGLSSDGVAEHATTPSVAKDISLPDSLKSLGQQLGPTRTATISFLPADIFDSTVQFSRAETGFVVSRGAPHAIKDAAGESADDRAMLAKKLRNPVSALARIYFESNLDFGLAADREGYRYTMNLEPVIPFALNKDWNLISRTRFPLIQQDGVVASTMQTGLGDILQSFYLSPSKTEPIFWGAGMALLIPTATDTLLGEGKFGLGPALVIGKQQGAWTYGALVRQIWSVAGHSDRADVRSTYVQPFLAYTTRSGWSYAIDTESTYDWVGQRWSVPIHAEVSKVVRFGRHAVSFGGALTCFAATPPGGPQACGVRFMVTPIFPAKY